MEIFLIIVGGVVLAIAAYIWQTKHVSRIIEEGREKGGDEKKEKSKDIPAHEKYNFDLMPEDRRMGVKIGFWQAVKLGFGFAFGVILLWLAVLAVLALLGMSFAALFAGFMSQMFQGMMSPGF